MAQPKDVRLVTEAALETGVGEAVNTALKPGGTAEGTLATAIAESTSLIVSGLVEESLTRNTALARGIVCRGDSQTAGQGGNGVSYPMELSKMLPGIPVEKRAYPGESAQSVSVRQGSTPLLVTFTAGEIQASGEGAITIKNGTTSNRMYFGADGSIGSPDPRALVGSVGGVRGQLGGNASSGYTFTRSSWGKAGYAVADMPFVEEWESTHRDWNQIVMVGRNGTDVGSAVTMGTKIAKFQTDGDYIILSVLSKSDEVAGTSGYTYVTDINEALATIHQERFIDVRGYLVHQALADLGLTPTTEDDTAVAGDTIPPQLMSPDLLHPNANGYKAIARHVHEKIVARGWTGETVAPVADPLGVDDYTHRFIMKDASLTDGSTVGSIVNTATSGAALTQVTPGSQPTARVAGGDAWLELDGVADYLEVAGYTSNHPVSVVMLVKANDAEGQSKTFARFTNSSTPQAVATTAAAASTYNWTVRGTSTAQGPKVTIADGKFHTLGAVINGTPGSTGTAIASVDTATVENSLGSVQTIDKLSFGDTGAGVGYAKMDIAEIVVWDRALTAAELVTVHNALKDQHPTLLT